MFGRESSMKRQSKESYIRELEPSSVDEARTKQKADTLTQSEKTRYPCIVATLAWPSRSRWSHMVASVVGFRRELVAWMVEEQTVDTVPEVHKLIEKAKKQDKGTDEAQIPL